MQPNFLIDAQCARTHTHTYWFIMRIEQPFKLNTKKCQKKIVKQRQLQPEKLPIHAHRFNFHSVELNFIQSNKLLKKYIRVLFQWSMRRAGEQQREINWISIDFATLPPTLLKDTVARFFRWVHLLLVFLSTFSPTSLKSFRLNISGNSSTIARKFVKKKVFLDQRGILFKNSNSIWNFGSDGNILLISMPFQFDCFPWASGAGNLR